MGNLALVSLTLTSFQVIQTRLLSALFAYHYVFLVTSLSILGLGLGGLVLQYLPSLTLAFERAPRPSLVRVGLALAASHVVSFALVIWGPFWGNPVIYALILFVPEFIGGIILALSFRHFKSRIGALYASDLIGAAFGFLFVVTALDRLGFLRTWLMLIGLVFLAVLGLLLAWTTRARDTLALGLLAVAVIALPSTFESEIRLLERNFAPYRAAPSKLIHDMLEERGNDALSVVSTRWDSFGRTDVFDIEGEPDRKALTIDGVAYSGIYRFKGDIGQLTQYPDTAGYLPSIGNLPFVSAAPGPVLVIGSGGGRDLLYALRAGSNDIDAVEVNQASIDAVRQFGSFNGHLYDRPDVHIISADARLFVQSTRRQYAVILLSLVKTEASTSNGMALAENFVLTKEALSLYFDHLTARGRIALLVHHEAALAKVVATALEVLVDKGIPTNDAPSHLAVIGSKNLDPVKQVFQPLTLVSKQPFTAQEGLALAQESERTGNLISYIPHVREDGRLQEIRDGKRPINAFAEALPYDARPATDDTPYFYHFDNSSSTPFWMAAVAIAFVGLGLFFRPVAHFSTQRDALLASLLGVGFMLIEIPLIQKLGLAWGSSTRSFSTVVSVVLASAGVGSLASSAKWVRKWNDATLASAAAVGILSLATAIIVNRSSMALAQQAMLPRFFSTAALILPLGFFMGMQLPRLIENLPRRFESQPVPLLWAINGVASVLGSTLAVPLSMSYGLSATMGLGAVAYLLVFIFSRAR